MPHGISSEDQDFLARFESGAIPAADFDHRSHVRLAYVRLCQGGVDSAHAAVREGLLGFLTHHGIDPSAKYHETLTRGWLLAVKIAMDSGPETASAAEFIAANPALLNSKALLEHYSKDLLFSDEARRSFVEPDLTPIPVRASH